MKKFSALASLAGVALLLFVFTGTASANPEFKVCHSPPGNPGNTSTLTVGSYAAVLAHLAHGDKLGPCGSNGPTSNGDITIVDEPAGANCPNGGIKVTVVKGRPDGDNNLPNQVVPPGAVEPSEDPGVVTTDGEGPPPPNPRINPPRPDPADQVFYVCDGATGPAGPAGPAGPQGPIGPQGPAGPPGIAIPTPTTPKVCQSSSRLGVRMFLPPQLARFGVVQLRVAKVNGPLRLLKNVRTRVPRSGGGVFVFVPIRNRNCGSYFVSVGRPGIEPLIQIWQITGRFGLKRTTITG